MSMPGFIAKQGRAERSLPRKAPGDIRAASAASRLDGMRLCSLDERFIVQTDGASGLTRTRAEQAVSRNAAGVTRLTHWCIGVHPADE